MRLFKNFMKIFKVVMTDGPKTKPFSIKLCETIDRAEKVRKLIFYSNLAEKDRLQIADEILYIIEDLQELQTIKLKEEEIIWETTRYINLQYGLF